MKRFSVFVQGENFFLAQEDSVKRLGFYTTVYVYALSEEDAEHKALDIIRNDQKLHNGILNDKSDPPMMFIEKVTETSSNIPQDRERTGYVFYEDEMKSN
tara:strand:- start:714 stop:1013 length:300 start_codon:yes stop_codon:yes gene_type:complete